jgi:hypothetical protein
MSAKFICDWCKTEYELASLPEGEKAIEQSRTNLYFTYNNKQTPFNNEAYPCPKCGADGKAAESSKLQEIKDKNK